MIKIKDVLNAVAFILTLVLVLYGISKGYDLIEFFIYDIYFLVVIIAQILNLFEE